MFERQVHEDPFNRCQHRVEAAPDSLLRDLPRLWIGRECQWGTPMNVSAELIQQDQQRERTARRFRPGIECPFAGGAQRFTEPAAGLVELGIFGEPSLAPGSRFTGEPKIQYVVRRHRMPLAACRRFPAAHASALSRSRTECTASRPDRSRIW